VFRPPVCTTSIVFAHDTSLAESPDSSGKGFLGGRRVPIAPIRDQRGQWERRLLPQTAPQAVAPILPCRLARLLHIHTEPTGRPLRPARSLSYGSGQTDASSSPAGLVADCGFAPNRYRDGSSCRRSTRVFQDCRSNRPSWYDEVRTRRCASHSYAKSPGQETGFLPPLPSKQAGRKSSQGRGRRRKTGLGCVEQSSIGPSKRVGEVGIAGKPLDQHSSPHRLTGNRQLTNQPTGRATRTVQPATTDPLSQPFHTHPLATHGTRCSGTREWQSLSFVASIQRGVARRKAVD